MCDDDANEEQAKILNDKFVYNLMLAKGLVQLLPSTDRQTTQLWFEKLTEMDKNLEDMKIRNDYIWFILLMLHNNKIQTFFKDLPPPDIVPLRNVISQNKIDEVMLANEDNMSWLDTICTEHQGDEERKNQIPPCIFLDHQPVPKEGVVCYLSAFSDH